MAQPSGARRSAAALSFPRRGAIRGNAHAAKVGGVRAAFDGKAGRAAGGFRRELHLNVRFGCVRGYSLKPCGAVFLLPSYAGRFGRDYDGAPDRLTIERLVAGTALTFVVTTQVLDDQVRRGSSAHPPAHPSRTACPLPPRRSRKTTRAKTRRYGREHASP